MIYMKLFLYAHNGCFLKKMKKIHSILLLGKIFLKANVRLGFKKAVCSGVWPHAVVVNKNSESSKLNSTSRFFGDIGMIFEKVKWVFVPVMSASVVADLIKDASLTKDCPTIS